jgi:hypothetical protein
MEGILYSWKRTPSQGKNVGANRDNFSRRYQTYKFNTGLVAGAFLLITGAGHRRTTGNLEYGHTISS